MHGPTGADRAAFDRAEQDLFDAVGLDVRRRVVELAEPAVRTTVFEAGPSVGTDPPLVFVHGTGAFGAFLAPLMAALDDRRLVGFDRPGYGHSRPYEYAPRSLRRTAVGVVAGVLDDLGVEEVDLVGHSMGGYAALSSAVATPDRVRTLSLVGSIPTLPGTGPPLALRLSVTPGVGRVVRRLLPDGEAGAIADLFGDGEAIRDHPALVRALAAHEDLAPARAAARSEFRSLMTLRGWRPAVGLGPSNLAAVGQPTAVVVGRDDPVGGPGAIRPALASIPDVTVTTVDGGHFPHLGAPAACAEAIRAASR